MPRTCIDTADAIELTETLQLIAHWLAADHERLAASLLGFIGHPAYGPDALRADLDRFAFLLGGNDGEFLLGEDPALSRHPPDRGQNSRTEITRPAAKCGQNSLSRLSGQYPFSSIFIRGDLSSH
jgi:hypothetical protein